MNILAFYRTRTYFVRLLLSISFLVAAFLAVFCSVLYFYAKNNATKLQQEATRKVLLQVNYNVDNLYETVASLTVSAFADRDIAALLNNRDIDIFQQYNRLSKLDYIVNTNLFVHSLYLYNPYNRCYYIAPQSQTVACGEPAADNLLAAYLRGGGHATTANLKLVPYRMGEGGSAGFVLTMLKQEAGSIMMINVKPEWLFDNIGAINDLTDRMLGNVMILDADRFISANGQAAAIDEDAGKRIAARIQKDGKANGDFVIGSGASKQIVLYATSPLTGWKLVSVQSYAAVYGSINKIGTFSLFMFICFLLLAVFVSIVISMKLYKPIGSLIQSIRTAPGSRDIAAANKDEIGYLSLYNERMMEKLSLLQEDKRATDSIAKHYFLRRLLLESETMAPDDMARQIRDYGLKLQPDGSFLVCLMMMTGSAGERKPAERSLLRFAISNVAGEVLGAAAPNETVTVGEQIAVLLSAERADAERIYGELPAMLERVQETLYRYYRITTCAAIGPVAARPRDIAGSYERAVRLADYRLVFGKAAVITPERAAGNEASNAMLAGDMAERRWLETMRAGDLKKIETELAGIFSRMSTYRYDYLLQALHYLTAATTNELREKLQGLDPAAKNALLVFNRRVLEQETLDDMFMLYMELFQQLDSYRHAAKDNKHQLLADAVKEAIEAHYADPNLSLQSLAAMLRMSAAHVGKLFRLSAGMSVADYINDVRIARATAMLRESDATIVQIMEAVGFVSESHFYRLFKKSVGLTPREFRTRHVLGHKT